MKFDTWIEANVPPGATDGPITITAPRGVITSATPFVVAPNPDGGVNLSWDDCGDRGTASKVFACDSNSGDPFSFFASFVPPDGLTAFFGISAQVDLRAGVPSLPDWWKHGSGQCRGTNGLLVSFDSAPPGCTDLYEGAARGGFLYQSTPPSLDRARLLVQAVVPDSNVGPLDPGTEYFAFRVQLARSKSTGAGSCSGCGQSMCIVLNEVQLFQSSDEDFYPKLGLPWDRNFVSWQGTPATCPLSTPTTAALVTAEASSDRVRLEWYAAQSIEAGIERRRGTDWRQVAVIRTDTDHRLRYEDLDVKPGETYGYRLAIVEGADIRYAGEVTVTVPLRTTLGVQAVAWDRNGGGAVVSLTLPRAGNARIEMFDLAGRRLTSRRLEGLGPGEHEVRLPASSRLAAGVYFVRLTQGSAAVDRRFAMLP